MQRLLYNLPKMYNNMRNTTLQTIQSAKITSLQLNKQPLPKQPVLDLNKTAEKYLRSVMPLLTEDEYKRTEKIVQDFVSQNGLGPKLQEKLIERFKNTDNWMNEWWLKTAYLGYRAPVIVNSSPGTVGAPINFKTPEDFYVFAAQLIQAVIDYDHSVKSGKVKQEMIRDVPLDMQPYAMILGTHRQPNRKCDNLLHTDNTNHIIIMSNNHFFKLCIVDECGVLSESKLIAAIKDIVQRSCAQAKPVGILTGNDRDTWAEDYNLLLELGNNKCILKEIETSLFMLCLDKDLPKEVFKQKNVASVRAVQSMTGFNSCTNAGNRWHDKTVQFIVSTDGFVGMEYEHSPCEGIPIAVLHDHVIKYISSKKNDIKNEIVKEFPKAELLEFEINNTLECAIAEATKTVNKISADIDMECFTFDKFGTDEIKGIKFSPDSFIQIAMQVTFYKLQGKPPAHYESAALRRFTNARTECIRSTSCESVAFAKVMALNDSTMSKEKTKELMVKAINAHKALAGQAAMGEGVDRHLYGLKMIAQSEGMELPELYKDAGFTKSTYFTLTSSQVPYKTTSFMCYGPVVPNGYGCCYNPRPKDILFACSSFKSSNETNSKDFADKLQETLCEMKDLGSI